MSPRKRAKPLTFNDEMKRRCELFYEEQLAAYLAAGMPEPGARKAARDALHTCVRMMAETAVERVDERQGFLPIVA